MFTVYGRIGRGRFWGGVLAALALILVALFGAVDMLGFFPSISPFNMPVDPWIKLAAFGICGLVALCWLVTTSVRRMHDRGRSGWWAIAALFLFAAPMFVALVDTLVILPDERPYAWAASGLSWLALLWLFIDLGVLEGQDGPNRYGMDPRGLGSIQPNPLTA
jgi:uncharacterized membrane protein YhaH (DUF805 family)